MAKKEFQAESKKLMDMMINSIYTNKEIFLRELISNASDAIDKLYYKSLTDPSVGMNKGDFRILLTRDKDNRLLTVSDNGIGMTKERQQGREHRHHRSVRRGLLLRLHGRRQGHRHLQGIRCG